MDEQAGRAAAWAGFVDEAVSKISGRADDESIL